MAFFLQKDDFLAENLCPNSYPNPHYCNKLLSILDAANAKKERQDDRGRSLSKDEALKLPPHEIYATVFLSAPFFVSCAIFELLQ